MSIKFKNEKECSKMIAKFQIRIEFAQTFGLLPCLINW